MLPKLTPKEETIQTLTRKIKGMKTELACYETALRRINDFEIGKLYLVNHQTTDILCECKGFGRDTIKFKPLAGQTKIGYDRVRTTTKGLWTLSWWWGWKAEPAEDLELYIHYEVKTNAYEKLIKKGR